MSSSSSSSDVPPFHGFVETTVHALRLIHAARQGVIPRITRRLNDTERRTMIKSGAVFIFSVEESGIKRWTDGLLWSPSRIVGNFLVYREINERASSRGHKKSYTTEEPTRVLSAHRSSPSSLSAPYKGGHEQGTFKPNGLIKKTITVTIDGSDLHLISYYTSEDTTSGRLKKPTSRLDIMNLYMPPHIFRLTNFRVPPKIEIGSDGRPRLVSEPEEPDPVECKMEENEPYSPTHSHSPSSVGSSSPVDNPFTGGALYPISQMGSHSPSLGYRNTPSNDRWPTTQELRIIPRSSTSMSISSPTAQSHYSLNSSSSTRSRDMSGISQADTWGLQSPNLTGRWNEAYDSSSGTLYALDRTPRLRGSSSVYHTGPRGDSEYADGRYSSSFTRRESNTHSHQRGSWMHERETARGGHGSSSSYTHQATASDSGLPFPGSNSIEYHQQRYSGDSHGWTPRDHGSVTAAIGIETPPAFSSEGNALPAYHTQYATKISGVGPFAGTGAFSDS